MLALTLLIKQMGFAFAVAGTLGIVWRGISHFNRMVFQGSELQINGKQLVPNGWVRFRFMVRSAAQKLAWLLSWLVVVFILLDTSLHAMSSMYIMHSWYVTGPAQHQRPYYSRLYLCQHCLLLFVCALHVFGLHVHTNLHTLYCTQLPLALWTAAVIVIYALTFGRLTLLAEPFASTAMANHVMFHTSRLRTFATDLVYSQNVTYQV